MTEDPTARLMRIARYRIRSWEGHPEYPDMLAEAHFRAWKSYCAAREKGLAHPFQIAALSAAYAPIHWLERWNGRTSRNAHRTRYEHVPLIEADHLPTPGPEERVLDDLERAEAWATLERGFEHCTPRQQEILYRLFVLEEGVTEVGRRLGVNQAVIGKARDRALSRCRQEPRRARAGRLEAYSHCRKGHRMTPENQYRVCRRDRAPAIRCRECHNEARRARRARRKA